MDSTLLAVKHEFLKRDMLQVSIGYAVALLGLFAFAAKTVKLEKELSKVDNKNNELENENDKLQKDVTKYSQESNESIVRASRLSRENSDLQVAIMQLKEELARIKD